ncbi:MATE family efflux transporter [Eubacterium sp. An11]|uniref:MATE family efflux transporter n=1 Tax=Eubacterium sp. An11 TaxID=1965542 RepID=UPI000B379116|nr:MATE family efflux transporter [Eubacterium sp. An11]OUQ69168.1 MATE family efflux transporter [Eubacterium sp. An11]
MNSENKTLVKKLLVLVLPMALQNLMASLVSASDALMLGFLNQSSLSAVSLAGQVQFVLSLFLGAFTIGESVLAAQYWGKGEKHRLEEILGIVLRFSILVSFLFTVAALCAPDLLMRIFTNDEELIRLGASYLRITSFSYFFMGISQIYLCIMKNTGRALLSTLYSSSSVILNIIINAILIFGLLGFPKLGIAGAAIATSISRGVELALILSENVRQKEIRIRMKHILRPPSWLQKDYIHYTWPSLANQVIWGCGFTMTSVIMGHLGTDAVAANSIAQIAKNLAACLCLGIGTGAGIIIGNELGQGNLAQAKKTGNKLCIISLITGASSCVILFACIPVIQGFAGTLSPQAQDYLRFMLFVCSYYLIGKSFSATVIGGIFSAGGDTRFGLICDTINMWAIIVPVGCIAAFVLHLPVPVVYFLLNLDEFTKMPLEIWYYRKYRWVKNITK